MKNILATFTFVLLSSVAFAQNPMPECKDVRGNVLNSSVDQARQIMHSTRNRAQIFVTGTIISVLPDDTKGLPHQKFYIAIDRQINLQIVSNLDFGRIPLQVGQTVSVCGEYLANPAGMIHWTHFDPHGGHADGFTILNGQLYGQTEVATTGERRR
jgi:hypothetical protein